MSKRNSLRLLAPLGRFAWVKSSESIPQTPVISVLMTFSDLFELFHVIVYWFYFIEFALT